MGGGKATVLRSDAEYKLEGDLEEIGNVEMVDQSPIGRSARSNPVTYIKAYDAIRDLYSDQPAAKVADMKPGHFSFNVEGGRCETCDLAIAPLGWGGAASDALGQAA